MVKKKASGRISGRAAGRILMEGKVRKGGIKPRPTSPKPNITPAGQKPSSKKKN